MKGQSVGDYLMTYGWAILIVIIVATTLYFIGAFNPRESMELDEPNICERNGMVFIQQYGGDVCYRLLGDRIIKKCPIITRNNTEYLDCGVDK